MAPGLQYLGSRTRGDLGESAAYEGGPGRKTDVKDSQWIADLLRHGLLSASFIPPAPIRELRDLTRYRKNLVQERAQEINRLQKVLETANIKLASVAADVLGKSGRDMLACIIAGERDALAMAELARGRLRAKLPDLQLALEGRVQSHHQSLTGLDFHGQAVEIDALSHARVVDGKVHLTKLAKRSSPGESIRSCARRCADGHHHVAAALLDADFHGELCVFGRERGEPVARVENLDVGIGHDVAGSHFARAAHGGASGPWVRRC